MPTDDEDERARLGALAAITAAAFALRAWGVGRYVVDLHELFKYHEVARSASLHDFFPLLRENPLHVLLDPLITFALSRFSTSLWWLRLQPVLIGTACIPALYALAKKVGGASLALFSCGLLAISIHHIEFSGFVDFYPFLVLWTPIPQSAHRAIREFPSGVATVRAGRHPEEAQHLTL